MTDRHDDKPSIPTPRTDHFVSIRRFEDGRGPLDAWARFARQLERELAEARGALADIAFSDDMTLDVARNKAKRVYGGERPELPVSAMGETSAWLIEMPEARWGTGFYWIGVNEYETWGEIDKAVRFARKEDAERVIESIHKEDRRRGARHQFKLEACEHIWTDGKSPRPEEVATLKDAERISFLAEITDSSVRRDLFDQKLKPAEEAALDRAGTELSVGYERHRRTMDAQAAFRAAVDDARRGPGEKE